MALIEEYYELNEAEEVSVLWKVIQILFYIAAGFLGVWCGYTIALLRIKFDDKCYLFTVVKKSNYEDDTLDIRNVNWENDSWCDYCQYSMVSSFIVAMIWATFFLMCGKGGKSLTGLPQPWRIVWSSLIFNFIYFIIALITAFIIQKGTDDFCDRWDFDKRMHTKSLKDSCESLKYFTKINLYVTALQIEIVAKSSWSCAASWFILFLLSFFRIIFVVDFRLYKVCVFKISDATQNKKEEVLRITNYEEPHKQYLADKQVNFINIGGKSQSKEEAGKEKVDNKFVLQYSNNLTSYYPTQPSAKLYVTGDLRMLNRDKRQKFSKFLEEGFENKGMKMEIRWKLEGSEGSGSPPYLYLCGSRPQELFHKEDQDSLSFGTRKKDSNTPIGGHESSSETAIFVPNFDLDRFSRFKKCL